MKKRLPGPARSPSPSRSREHRLDRRTPHLLPDVGDPRIGADRGAAEIRPLTSEEQELVRKIRQDYSDTLEKNLRVGAHLAQLRIPKAAWKLNLYNLPIGYSWACRLMKIAGDPRILSHRDRMPDSHGALHAISMLTNDNFDEALKH